MFSCPGGQEELQSLWDKYYAECHAIIYVVDSVDVERIDESMAAFRKMISNEHLSGVPLLLLANKQDLPGRGRFREFPDIMLPIPMNFKNIFFKKLTVPACSPTVLSS